MQQPGSRFPGCRLCISACKMCATSDLRAGGLGSSIYYSPTRSAVSGCHCAKISRPPEKSTPDSRSSRPGQVIERSKSRDTGQRVRQIFPGSPCPNFKNLRAPLPPKQTSVLCKYYGAVVHTQATGTLSRPVSSDAPQRRRIRALRMNIVRASKFIRTTEHTVCERSRIIPGLVTESGLSPTRCERQEVSTETGRKGEGIRV